MTTSPSLEELKAFAHRTPMRYMRDDGCPYQFAEHNLINFARLIIDWRDAQAAKQAVAVVEYSDFQTAASIVGDAPKKVAVRAINSGALQFGTKLYAAPMPAQAPEGWKFAPVNQTVEMREAGNAALDAILKDPTRGLADRAYYVFDAMLAAAPTPPNAASDDTNYAAKGICTWTHCDDEYMPGTWDGSCGAKWSFTEYGPEENNMKFCPECGGRVVIDDALKGGE